MALGVSIFLQSIERFISLKSRAHTISPVYILLFYGFLLTNRRL